MYFTYLPIEIQFIIVRLIEKEDLYFFSLASSHCKNLCKYITKHTPSEKLYYTTKFIKSKCMKTIPRCVQVVNDGIVHLPCWILDKDLEHFRGIPRLNLNMCKKITDTGLAQLTGIQSLHLNSVNITDAGLKYLSGIQSLHLKSVNITDAGLKYLSGIKELTCVEDGITDDGLQFLKGIKILRLPRNNRITNVGLVHLKGVHEVDLCGNMKTLERNLFFKCHT